MRHLENRMNTQKNTNSSTSANAVNPDQNINIAATVQHLRSPFGSTSFAGLTVKRMSNKGTARKRMSKKGTASDVPMGDDPVANGELTFIDVTMGSQGSQPQTDAGQRAGTDTANTAGEDADIADGQSSSVQAEEEALKV